VGHILSLSRQCDNAIEQYRKTVALDPTFVQVHLWFGRPYLQKAMYEEAISELEQAVKLSGASTISLVMLGQAYASSGMKAEMKAILDQIIDLSQTQYVPSYWIALVYVGLGDKDQAVSWLELFTNAQAGWSGATLNPGSISSDLIQDPRLFS